MKKNTLAQGIAFLICSLNIAATAAADVITGTGAPTATTLGTSNANSLDVVPGGIGHILINPYYNTQNGNATLINLTNTDAANGKAVKIRFRGASNSDDVFDFTLLMSPGDVWSATITAPTAASPAQLVTQDNSCTLPSFPAGAAQPFVTARLTDKGGNDLVNHTREGYIEIFNMADIPSAPVYGPGGNAPSALYTAIKHVDGRAPCTAAPIVAAMAPNHTTELAAASLGLATPTTGLVGNWTIINVPQTTTFSGEMVALRAVDDGGLDARGNFVLFPQIPAPYAGNIDWVTADPLLRTSAYTTMTAAGAGGGATAAPAIAAAHFDLPDLSTPYIFPAADANAPLSQATFLVRALAVRNIVNEYATDADISARTDWVFSMPTRRYSVAMDYAPAASRRLYSLVPPLGAQYFHDGNTSLNPTNPQQICVAATAQTFYSREEGTKSSDFIISPGRPSVAGFCGETSVLSFADTGDSVLSASVARQDIAPTFVHGWGNINVRNAISGLGLPILGGAFMKATNPAVAAGRSGTFGAASRHRFVR